MSEEQTIISPAAPGEAERTQIAAPPGVEVTQAAVVIECPVCHTTNPPGDRWCQDCGFLLSSAAPEALEAAPAGGPRLVLDGREFELHPGANTIGRANADVLLLDSTVSRHHATLTLEEEGAWLEDVGSTNGSFVNGTPLPSGTRQPLQDGDTLKLGSVTLKLVWPEGGARPEPSPEDGPSLATPEPAAPAAVARLVAADGREYLARLGVTSLGRRAENTVVVSGDPYVSGRHAEIRCDADGCVLVDVGSTNGTFVRREPAGDWERLAPQDPWPLAAAGEFRLGQKVFSFEMLPATEPEAEPGDAPSVAPDGEDEAAAAVDADSASPSTGDQPQ